MVGTWLVTHLTCENPLSQPQCRSDFETQRHLRLRRPSRHLSTPKAHMAGLTSIRTSGDSRIEIVNQLLLPHTTEFIEIHNIEEAHDAIKSMKVLFCFSLCGLQTCDGPRWRGRSEGHLQLPLLRHCRFLRI